MNNHKSMKIRKLILLFGIVLLSSCATPRYFMTLDVLKPAQVTFPLDVNRVLIVNNVTPNPNDIVHLNTSEGGIVNPVAMNFDSAGIFVTTSLRDELVNKSFFNKVELSNSNQTATTSLLADKNFSGKYINALCNLYQVDAVISLNRVRINDDISQYEFHNGGFGAELDANVKTNWTLYFPKEGTNTVQFVDSFMWQNEDYSLTKAVAGLPNRYNALVDACILSGANISERLIPYWDTVDRYLFAPKEKLMQQAMDSVPYRKWDAAILLWQNAANNTKSNKIKYMAYNNIAVAYEALGNIDKAIENINKSVDLSMKAIDVADENYKVFAYQMELNKRKQEIELLNKQLGN